MKNLTTTNDTITDSEVKAILKTPRSILKSEGYCIHSLWHITDVKSKFECTNDQAMEVLNKALNSDFIKKHVEFYIIAMAEVVGLEKKGKL